MNKSVKDERKFNSDIFDSVDRYRINLRLEKNRKSSDLSMHSLRFSISPLTLFDAKNDKHRIK